MSKRHKKTFHRRNMQIANKHIKTCLGSLAIRVFKLKPQ